MKKILIAFCFFIPFSFSYAQSKNEKALQLAVQKLTAAMLSGERASLESIVSEHLSYGHSGGHVEGKAEFVEKIASGKSDFVTINISEQTIDIIGKTAIVRHLFDGTTNDGGKPGAVKLKILLIFEKQGKDWKLLARQAVKA
ncbi:MAG: nuclear transport factor 2 family protein [Chitinophagaceae bacterium]